jgi:uncharacterized membrane protein YgaE (UPF0421/DUF939 family)
VPVAAGLAWYIAHTLLGHHQPFFAPTAAAVSLSRSRALRSEHAIALMAGVVLGIVIGAAVRAVAGPAPAAGGGGAIAVAVAVVTAAILMIAVGGAATAAERVSDALIGGGVALVMTVPLFPAAPIPLIRAARRVARIAPRRWPDRARVRHAGEQARRADLLAATVVSLAHAVTAEPAATPAGPWPCWRTARDQTW